MLERMMSRVDCYEQRSAWDVFVRKDGSFEHLSLGIVIKRRDRVVEQPRPPLRHEVSTRQALEQRNTGCTTLQGEAPLGGAEVGWS